MNCDVAGWRMGVAIMIAETRGVDIVLRIVNEKLSMFILI